MIGRSWSSSLTAAVIAAACALLAAGAGSWAFTAVAPNIWLDANLRSLVARDVVQTSSELESRHRPLAEIARTLVTRIQSSPGFRAAVVDESGRLLAGEKEIAAARPPGIRPEDEHRRRSGTMGPRMIYALHPPASDGISFVAWPLSSITSPPSMVRIDGGLVIFNSDHDALQSIQNIGRAFIVILVALTFGLVWLVSRQALAGALHPMDRVRAALLKLSQNDYTRLEALGSEDSAVTELVAAYNAAAAEMSKVRRRQAEVETKMREFVADAGHQLRTPLAVIMGYVQLLRQGNRRDDGITSKVFSEIDGQGERMSVLIQKLLLLTRLESQEPRDVKIMDASDVAQSVVESFRPLANGSALTLSAQPDAFVQVSESELRESIGNLLDNSLKYAPGASINTVVRSDDGCVRIAVADEGPGMAPDVRARAFERFSRGETAGSVTGSGLGLAIVERAAQRAGGSVSLDTALGKGTTVEMRLPAWQHVSKA